MLLGVAAGSIELLQPHALPFAMRKLLYMCARCVRPAQDVAARDGLVSDLRRQVASALASAQAAVALLPAVQAGQGGDVREHLIGQLGQLQVGVGDATEGRALVTFAGCTVVCMCNSFPCITFHARPCVCMH